MKKVILFSATLVALTLMAFTGKKIHVDTYKVDTKLSSLEWFAEKVNGKHNGTIMLSGGEIKNDHGNFTGSFAIDMNTIANTDLKDNGSREKLEKHLKSADFFDTEKYPKSTFVIISVTPITVAKAGGFTHTVKGNLTIKDKTNEITFDAVVKLEANTFTCAGTAIVDRSKFNVKYGSKTFFESIGDKMIYDEFTLKFKVVAVRIN